MNDEMIVQKGESEEASEGTAPFTSRAQAAGKFETTVAVGEIGGGGGV